MSVHLLRHNCSCVLCIYLSSIHILNMIIISIIVTKLQKNMIIIIIIMQISGYMIIINNYIGQKLDCNATVHHQKSSYYTELAL